MGRFLTLGGVANAGFFGPAPVAGGGGATVQFSVPGISFGSTGPSSNGPGQTFFGGAGTSGPTPSGFTAGFIVPNPTLIKGQQLCAFGACSTSPVVIPPNGLFFLLIIEGGALPQNFFTALDFDTINPVQTWHLTSAGAMFNTPWDDTATGIGYSTWVWPNGLSFVDLPSFPNPITVTL